MNITCQKCKAKLFEPTSRTKFCDKCFFNREDEVRARNREMYHERKKKEIK